MKTETLRCHGCDRDFTRAVKRGKKPRHCPPCGGPDPVDPARYGLAKKVTDYRVAIEIAKPAIRLGRYEEALLALEQVTR